MATAQPTAASRVIRDSTDEFVAIFRVLELFILLLALLIAYDAATINTDERRRDHATLFAFGLPLRRVVRMDVTEGVLPTSSAARCRSSASPAGGHRWATSRTSPPTES